MKDVRDAEKDVKDATYEELKTWLVNLKEGNKDKEALVKKIDYWLDSMFDLKKNPDDKAFLDFHTFLFQLNGMAGTDKDQIAFSKIISSLDMGEFKESRIVEKKVNELLALCQAYKNNLKNELEKSGYTTGIGIDHLLKSSPDLITDNDIVKCAIKKYQCVKKLIESFENTDKTPKEKLRDFKTKFTKSKKILEERRDSAATTFLKGVLTVLTLGIAAAFGIWKSKGAELNKNIEDILPTSPKI